MGKLFVTLFALDTCMHLGQLQLKGLTMPKVT